MRNHPRETTSEGETLTCTAPECDNPATLYLCIHCIRDLQAWIDKVPETRAMLFTTMAKLDNTAPSRGEGGNGATKEAPLLINEAAMEKRHALRLWENQDAQNLAHDEHSGGYLPMLKRLIETAERIMDNHPETRVITTCSCGGTVTTKSERPEPTKDNPDPEDWGTCQTCKTLVSITRASTANRVAKAAPPMPTRELLPWLRANAKMEITSQQIRHWVMRGHLKPVTREPSPTYHPHEVIAAWHERNNA